MEESENKQIVKKAAILKKDEIGIKHLFYITLTKDILANTCTVQLGKLRKEDDERPIAAIIKKLPENVPKDVENKDVIIWNYLVENITNQGYLVDEMPLANTMKFSATVDAKTGKILYDNKTCDGSLALKDIQKNMAIGIKQAFQRVASINQKYFEDFKNAVQNKDYQEALELYKKYGFSFKKEEDLFENLNSINYDSIINEDHKQELFAIRIATAEDLEQFEFLEKHIPIYLDSCTICDEMKNCALFLQAKTAQVLNKKETAIYLFEELLKIETINAEQRGSSLYYLAELLEKNNPTKYKNFEMAADFLLQAGKILDAVTIKMHLSEALFSVDLKKALTTIEEAEKLLNLEDNQHLFTHARISYTTAMIASKLGVYEPALEEALKAIDYIKDLEGDNISASRYNYYSFAADVAKKLKKFDEAESYTKIANEMELTFDKEDISKRKNVFEALANNNYEELEDISHNGIPLKLFANMGKAIAEEQLTFKERLDLLDEVSLNIKNNDSIPATIHEVLSSTYAGVYLNNKNEIKALEWYKKALYYNPYNPEIRNKYCNLLQKNNLWQELEDYMAEQIKSYGEQPSFLALYGKALYMNNHKLEEAYSALRRARKDCPDKETEKDIENLIDALDEKKIIPSVNISILNDVAEKEYTLNDFNNCLEDFINHIQNDQRMEFWHYDKKEKKHKWNSRPENIAKRLFQSYLNARFGNNIDVDVIEEAKAGAGYIDLFIRLSKNLKIIVELKVCGHGYPAKYAMEGLQQLDHYLTYKGTSLGYLVVFDSSKNAFKAVSKEKVEENNYTIFTKAIDVNPKVKP